MRIAQIAPLYESVPPKLYGGTERVVSYLTEALVDLGHEVTLFASGDSQTSAKLVPMCKQALRLDKKSVDPVADHIYLVEQLLKNSHQFDIIHFHIDYLSFPAIRRIQVPSLVTLHGRLDIPNLKNVYEEFKEIPLVSISYHQRRPLSWVNWAGMVYHGLPENLYHYQRNEGKYLAFLGRISPEKRVDRAIEIAKKSGLPLKIAAKIDAKDEDYYKKIIRPMLNDSKIEYVGEIGENEKKTFLANASALLFPIDWPEPFGLVMIEAMACGTPTIAYPHGAVLEVVKNKETGFIVQNFDEAVQAIDCINEIERKACRERFEKHFTAKRMAKEYLEIYKTMIESTKMTKIQEKRAFLETPHPSLSGYKSGSMVLSKQ